MSCTGRLWRRRFGRPSQSPNRYARETCAGNAAMRISRRETAPALRAATSALRAESSPTFATLIGRSIAPVPVLPFATLPVVGLPLMMVGPPFAVGIDAAPRPLADFASRYCDD